MSPKQQSASAHRQTSARNYLSNTKLAPLRTLTAVGMGLICTVAMSEAVSAQGFFWSDDEYIRPAPPPPPAPLKRASSPRDNYPKLPTASKNAPKPSGTLLVSISLKKQRMKVYDDNGLFAETAISSGKAQNPTPTGIFSVIQKSKWHRSNLYSDAPMPFMQRLTWSGIAIHAGALPGYPASHGCIRVPMTFASEIWGWSRMGARVVVSNDPVEPQPISHALLPLRAPGVEDVPVASAPPQPQHTQLIKPASTFELRPALLDPASNNQLDLLNERVVLANAASVSPSLTGPQVMSDAMSSLLHREAPDSKLKIANTDTTGVIQDSAGAPLPEPAVAEPVQAEVREPVEKGRVAAFISRADNRLYVRRNFIPMFDVEITISDDNRPLGTHLYTTAADKDVKGDFRWTSISMDIPVSRPNAAARKAAKAPVTEVIEAAPSSANEALDRLSIPPETMRKIAEMMTPGSSLLISDRSLKTNKETGRGTDFILSAF